MSSPILHECGSVFKSNFLKFDLNLMHLEQIRGTSNAAPSITVGIIMYYPVSDIY